MNDSLENIKVTGLLCLDVTQLAYQMNNRFAEFMKPDKEGIYVNGEINPRLVLNKQYKEMVIVNGKPTYIPFTDINNITNPIVDENEIVVIPKYMMMDKKKYLFNYPTIPARFYHLIFELIKYHISMVSQIPTFRAQSKNIYNLLKDDVVDLNGVSIDIFESGHIGRFCDMLLQEIDIFIGNDNWHLYFTKFNGKDIYIEKTEDYRVREYHRRIANGEWS